MKGSFVTNEHYYKQGFIDSSSRSFLYEYNYFEYLLQCNLNITKKFIFLNRTKL